MANTKQSKQKTRVRSQLNYIFPGPEVNDEVSMTIPGQSMSIAQYIERMRNGVPITLNRAPYDDNDLEEMPIKFKDLTDLDEAKDVVKRVEQQLKKDPGKTAPGTNPKETEAGTVKASSETDEAKRKEVE